MIDGWQAEEAREEEEGGGETKGEVGLSRRKRCCHWQIQGNQYQVVGIQAEMIYYFQIVEFQNLVFLIT